MVLIDVAKLGQAAFDEGGLRELLQSPAVLKLVFDGRNDARARPSASGPTAATRHLLAIVVPCPGRAANSSALAAALRLA